MKSIPVILATLAAVVTVAAAFSTKLFTVVFEYPADGVPELVTFRVHMSTNVALPVEQWEQIEMTWVEESRNSNVVTFVSATQILAHAPFQFLAVSASNVWGGPVFSDILTSTPPRSTQKIHFRQVP